jgi:hypothetical protein
MVHGWSDPALSGFAPVDYYKKVAATMGADQTADFFRLLMALGPLRRRTRSERTCGTRPPARSEK